MGFKCGIIGLPNVGKSTLFNALTESNKAEVANYPFATIEPNVGRVAVPDDRLNILAKISKSEKIIPTYIDFVDIAGLVKGASSGEGLGNKFLSHIREVDAIIHVVRCFKDNNITHINNDVSPLKDIETIKTELLLADIEVLERKIQSLQKKQKSGDKKIIYELKILSNLLKKIDENLSNNLYESEIKIIDELNLITTKPTMYICNVDEKSILKGNNFSKLVHSKALSENNVSINISASIEAQISELENEEEKLEFINDLDLKETTLNRLIKSGYNLLNLITFFTSGPEETRAWTVEKNTEVSIAAGKIHSDFQKGFIRAETIKYEDYKKFNGELGVKEAGKLKQEGKGYIVKDGDIFHFLFNV